jgi:hypothetical protein
VQRRGLRRPIEKGGSRVNTPIITDRVLRLAAAIAASIVLVNAAFLLVAGATAEIVAATPPDARPATPVTSRAPVVIAAVPLLCSSLALWGCLRPNHALMIGGGIALIVAGIGLMWSFGIWIAFSGLVVVLAGVVGRRMVEMRS